METIVTISICVLLISAYIFDITSSKTKIPSVILLLILGWAVKQLSTFFSIIIPDLTPLLPFLGSIGLILIVLEGSLEVELNRSKFSFVFKSFLMSVSPVLILSFGLGWAFYYYGDLGFKDSLANAIPYAIVSSAIAIPSVAHLGAKNREFIIYESSLSDIFGVLFFNFIILNESIGSESVSYFLLDVVMMLVITAIATLGLAFLLNKIKHHVKFVPIIISLILVYEISHIFHLPALLFIMLFGLFMGNLDELKNIKFIQRLHPEILNEELHKFKELTGEMAFLIRGMFFLVFGFLIETKQLLNPDTIIWAVIIVSAIFVMRFIFLKLFKIQLLPLVFIAPRGLITILLFLSIPALQRVEFSNQSLIIQVILMTAVIMMLGLMTHKKKKIS